jgi:hypothetical protein
MPAPQGIGDAAQLLPNITDRRNQEAEPAASSAGCRRSIRLGGAGNLGGTDHGHCRRRARGIGGVAAPTRPTPAPWRQRRAAGLVRAAVAASVPRGAIARHPGEIVRPFRHRSHKGATMAVSGSGTVRQVRPAPASGRISPSGGRSAFPGPFRRLAVTVGDADTIYGVDDLTPSVVQMPDGVGGATPGAAALQVRAGGAVARLGCVCGDRGRVAGCSRCLYREATRCEAAPWPAPGGRFASTATMVGTPAIYG